MILLLASLSAATATTCLVFEEPSHRIFPRTTAALPPNLQPLVRGSGEEEITLANDAGLPVPITVALRPSFDGVSVREVTPTALLAPGHYALQVGDSTARFEIAGPPDHAAALGGTLLGTTWHGPWAENGGLDYLGRDQRLDLDLEPVHDTHPALREVRWATDPEGPWTMHTFWPGELTYIGRHICPPDTAPPPEPGVPLYIQARSRDAAGQLSSWGEALRVVPGALPSRYPSPDLAGGLLLLVGLLSAGALGLVVNATRRQGR